MKPSLIAIAFACAVAAPAQNLRIVNAASLSTTSFAPGSIITIFGMGLTNGVVFAPDVQKPPTNLGGVTVSIGGVAAALFYVSPVQINAVVDAKTPLGTQTLTIISSSGNRTGSVTIDT